MPYKAEKMQPSVCVFGPLEARENGLVFVELAFLNSNIDPDDILPHDAPCTNIQMSVSPPPVSGTSGKMMERGQTPLPNFP